MSFLSILKSIGHALGTVAGDIAPFSGAIAAIPVGGPIAATILNAIGVAEQTLGAGAGAAKKAAATATVNAAAPGLNQATLSAVIDNTVAALNAIQAAMKTLPATAPATSGGAL
jgi:hypothetical protein